MKTIALIFVCSTFLPFTLAACPNLNGLYTCKDLQTGDETKETFTTDLSRKTMTTATLGEGSEKYLLDAGKKVLVPSINETVDFEDGKLLLSITHYNAICLSSKSMKVEFSTSHIAQDNNGTVLARENTIFTSVIDDVTSSDFTRSTEGKIFGDDFITTELCTKNN